MSKLIIMQGLPASGKSTKAQEIAKIKGAVRINKDLLRTMLHFDNFTINNETKTSQSARALAKMFLLEKDNVIIDDTNLNPNTVKKWVNLAKECEANIEYVRLDTSIDECLARDRLRTGNKRVGDHVIFKMALRWCNYLIGKEVVLCDLDGTLCDVKHRVHHVQKEPKDWKSFFAEIKNDKVKMDVKNLLDNELAVGRKIIFMSARPEDYRQETEDWLSANCPNLSSILIMREKGDRRPDTEIKSSMFDMYFKHLRVVRIYDDRPSVIRMWREKFLEVLDCGDGVEF